MKRHYCFIALLCTLFTFSLNAQDNLSVNFVTIPDFLNVCGESDAEVVSISVAGASTEIRSGIEATARFFDGMELVSFDAAGSSPGVLLIDNSDPSAPIFQIPDLDPVTLTSVNISLEVKALCEYIDTLRGGSGIFDVVDNWELNYDLGAMTDQNETQQTESYRDALAFPVFNIQMNNTFGPAKLGDCYDRTINLSNDGIEGFVDSLIYETVQGAGVYLSNILIEGNPVPFSKSLNVDGDTVITVNIGATIFNTIGDFDEFIDPSETMVITEQICLIDCLGDRSSLHNIMWGCESRFCETISTTDFVVVGQGLPDAQAYQTGTVPDIESGYCQTGSSTITYVNEGIEVDAGFGTMLDVSTGISLAYTGTFGLMANEGFEIVEMFIAGVAIPAPNYLIDLEGNVLFMVDPDGPGGLSDFDGDGFFDDLQINEAIEIRISYIYDCDFGLSPADDCDNELSNNFSSLMHFSNACGVRSETQNLNYFGIKHKKTEEEYITETDAFLDTDVFILQYEHKRVVEGFGRNCSADEEYHVQVVLPAGVSLVPTSTLVTVDNLPLTLKSNTVSNDTLLLIYDATPGAGDAFPIQHVFNLAFEADCSADLGPTNFPFELSHYCPDCDCKHLWHCEEFPGPYLHTTNPPCPPLLCPVGVQATSFNVERTTFGFQDELYTTAFDQSTANKKAGIGCDSVEMTITNIVGQTALSDSIGMVITYENPDGSLSADETFIFAGGNLRIVQGATVTNCKVEPSQATVTTVDSTKYLDFDLNTCLTDIAITVNPNDSLIFTAKFTINPNMPADVAEFSDVPNLRGYGYATVDGVDYACDNYGDDFTVGKIRIETIYPNTGSQILGCQEVTFNAQISSSLNRYIEIFGFEHRPVIQVDSLAINYDPAMLESFDQLTPTLIYRGHPTNGDTPIALPAVESFAPGRYVVYLDTLDWGPSLVNSASTNPFDFSISAVPNCQTDFGSSGMSGEYTFNPEIHFYEYAYALDYGDGSCANYVQDAATGISIQYDNKPDINFIPLTSPNFNLTEDTATWTVQYCNIVDNADIGFSWYALEDPTGGIEVVKIEDISLPTSPVDLTVRSYGATGNNYIVYTDGLLRSNGINGLEEICNTIKITAVADECGTLNFVSRAGWNCLPPTEVNWTPADYDPCVDYTMDMSLINQDPFLDADVETEPDPNTALCESKEIVIILRNTQLGTVYDLQSDIILPGNGVTIVPGSVEIAYPSSAPFVPVAADPVFAGTNANGNIYRYDDFTNLSTYLNDNGLQGANILMPSDSNELRLRYLITTNCDFVAGERTFFSFRGVQGCGDFSNTESGETNILNINGLPDPSDNGFDIAFAPGASLIPGELSTITINVTNTNPNPTDANDFILLEMSNDILYQSGSSAGINPGSWTPGDPTAEVDGANTTYYWNLPLGLAQGETASFSFQVQSPIYDCSSGTVSVDLFTIVRTIVNCASAGMDCEIESMTSSNAGISSILNIFQQSLLFSNLSYTSACLSDTEELVSINGALLNSGDEITASTITVNYYYDEDNSGTVTAGDVLVQNENVPGPVPMMGQIPFVHSFALGLDSLCGIIAAIDTVGLNVCSPDEYALGDPQLLNAGGDQLFCTVTPTTITSELGTPACVGILGYAYNWTAIAPALASDLSATDIPNPVLTVNHDALAEDTLQYIVTTSRGGCGGILTTSDTINIIRGLGVILTTTSPISTSAGVPVSLNLTAANGTLPYTYSWSPTAGLDDPTSANPTATVFVNTTYTVTVTSATGCEETTSIDILLENCIQPDANSIILTQTNCGGENGSTVIHLAQNESGYDFTWTPDLGITNMIGNERTNLPAGGYRVIIEALGDGSCVDSIDFVISTYDGPQVDTTITPATCAAANGTASLLPDTLQYDWSDGGMGAIRTDLAAGNYFVTAYDAADPSCTNVVLIEIGEVSDLIADVVINNHASDCGASDGSAIINVNGGSGVYSFSWSSGFASNSNLSNGFYQVTVTDLGGNACEAIVNLVINGGDGLGTVVQDDVTNVSCAMANNGSIDFTSNIDPMLFTVADTIITNGVDTFANGNLPGGDYCLLLVDATNCVGGSLCFTIEEPNPMLLVFTITPPCPENGNIDLEVKGGTPDYIYDWADLDVGIEPQDRAGISAGNYEVLVTDANGCFISENEIFVGSCSTLCDYFFGETVISEFVEDCEEMTTICLDIISDDIDQYEITDNGDVYTGNFVGCNNDTTYYYDYGSLVSNLPPPYVLVSWSANGNTYSGDFPDFAALADSMNIWDAEGTWINDSGAQDISGGATGGVYGLMQIESVIGIAGPAIDPFVSIDPNSLALEIGQGMHTIIVRDTIGGCSDTLVVNLECPPYELQSQSLCIGEQVEFTIDPAQLDLEGEIVSMTNVCEDSGGENVDFKFTQSNLLISYLGLSMGSDTACIELTTDMGSIDTIFFFIDVMDCENLVCDTVYINQTKTFCLDVSNLSGPITSIENDCPEESGIFVEFEWDVTTGCVDYTGLEIGQDTACIIYCDAFANCDTTYFCIETIPYFDPPIANDDSTSTDEGTPVVIDFKANDILWGGIDTAYILSGPSIGTLGTPANPGGLNLDCTVTYTPDEDYCEVWDQFSYVVCTPNGCDTADVYIWIECSDIIIYTAVSPNNDGVNDVFYIGGIGEYPNNELEIYNRWGNRVYQTKGYNNEWNGQWNTDREVPDGTYYYLLKLNDPEGRVFSGYFELYR